MNLILWRHAEAGDALSDREADMQRPLSRSGLREAVLAANWLRPRMPERTRVLVSPAQRAIETARALSDNFQIAAALGPECGVEDVLASIDWPNSMRSRNAGLVLVGHQPWIGNLAALLVAGAEAPWSVRKGAIWWLARRARGTSEQTTIRAVLSPDLL